MIRSVFVGGEGWDSGGMEERSIDSDGLWEDRDERRVEIEGEEGADCGESVPVISLC